MRPMKLAGVPISTVGTTLSLSHRPVPIWGTLSKYHIGRSIVETVVLMVRVSRIKRLCSGDVYHL